MKLLTKKLITCAIATSMIFNLAACNSDSNKSTDASDKFTPKLDTEKSVTLDIAGFMANFEALDQVVNNFNEIYPNVTITYEQNNQYMLADYLDNNQGIDIFMTDNDGIMDSSIAENYVADYCIDLSQEDFDLNDIIKPELLSYCCDSKGQLLRIPIMSNPCGMVVNKTLLEKEGLKIPENYNDFIDVLSKLKDKGYIPIQGSAVHVYSELAINMMMTELGNNENLLDTVKSGDESAIEEVKPVFDKLKTIIDNGYTDYNLNSELPDDNYDASILNFFKGDVPFYVCTAECFSGTKKRESKSEEFSANPFDYEFMYVPLGDKGVYEYVEPWYGFSISKNSDAKDYAVEFLRFLTTKEQLNTMASIKGMPSVVKGSSNERYPDIDKIKNLQDSFINDGSVDNSIREAFTQISNDLGAGVYENSEAAAKAFVSECSK